MAKKSMMKMVKKMMPMCLLIVVAGLIIVLFMVFGKGYMEGYATKPPANPKMPVMPVMPDPSMKDPNYVGPKGDRGKM